MRFLQRKKIQFIAKIARNRVIESVNGIRAQINKHNLLKLVKNNRSKRLKVKYANITLYISVHKRKNKKGEFTFLYIACNKCLTAKIYLSKYEERWEIEKMFRTMKQSLGLAHCQSRKIDKQKLHIYFVFNSYGFLEMQKIARSLKNPEEVIRALEKLKSNVSQSLIQAFKANFAYVA